MPKGKAWALELRATEAASSSVFQFDDPVDCGCKRIDAGVQGRDGRLRESGDPSVSLAEVMITAQKASLQFTGMTEVRNKLLNAYQEVMNMPV